MNSQEIEITIHPDGRVDYLIRGVNGSACEGISELLEVLGAVEKAERTGEYYARNDEIDLQVHSE